MSERGSQRLHTIAGALQKKLHCLQSVKPNLWRLSKSHRRWAICFGENYVQEGVDKIHSFVDNKTLEWHFIGPLQSNKSRLVAENFAWCHTVDRLKIAQRLSAQRPAAMPALNVLIQINISDEQSKAGISLSELPPWLTALVHYLTCVYAG